MKVLLLQFMLQDDDTLQANGVFWRQLRAFLKKDLKSSGQRYIIFLQARASGHFSRNSALAKFVKLIYRKTIYVYRKNFRAQM